MGNYNPHAPQILGNEWAAIRQSNFVPDDAITERGYITTIGHSAAVVTGAFYVSQPPLLPVVGANELIAVYPAGTLDQTGPIRTVVIPVTNVTTTGAGIFATAARLNNPSDVSHCSIAATSSGQGFSVSFDVSSYTAALDDKRILDVGLEYIAAGPTTVMANIDIRLTRAADISNGERYSAGLTGPVNISTNTEVQYVSLSELNSFWTTGVTVQSEPRAYPWRYEELNLFSASATPANDRLVITFISFSDESNDDVVVSYAALRVTYCEEQRVAYGAVNIMGFTTEYSPGYNNVMLRDPSFVIGPTLPPGEYAVTTTHVNRNPTVTDLVGTAAPTLWALQELYEIPSLQGVQINRSLVPDDTFTFEYNDAIPALSLHTTSAIVTGSHVYGVQIQAPSYTSITVTQELDLRNAPDTAMDFAQVRFYARRSPSTTSPLTIAMTGSATTTATITVAEFDALPEIVDGWKEVTLRFDAPISLVTAAGVEDFVWSSTGTADGQWQILGGQVPAPNTPQAPGNATYLAPHGASDRLTWKEPNDSVAGADLTADVALMISQDPPTVSGFAVTQDFQAVATVGLNCGVPNGCIPTGIGFNQLSWDNNIVIDTFSDSMVSGWGTTDTNETWSLVGPINTFIVTGGVGQLSFTAAEQDRSAYVPVSTANVAMSIDVSVPELLASGTFEIWIKTRYTDESNFYLHWITVGADGTMTAFTTTIVAGVAVDIASSIITIPYTAGMVLNITVSDDENIHTFVIAVDGVEQARLAVINTTALAGTNVALGGYIQTGATLASSPFYITFDNLLTMPAAMHGGGLQIQRQDIYDTDWHTILDTRNLATLSFEDYEARVGVSTDYRMRILNSLDFAGPWVTGSGTIAAPGVQITGDGNSVLIFTTNVGPTGNLAYTMIWEGQPIESFVFPEVDTVQLQRMFGKNFMTAFRPLERGGERFQRTLLVNAAAIALPSLANFRGLRDLAWADVPYICVRDELGNRWFATVLVPSGDVKVDRQLYLAQIDVIETSETPYAVDPA